MEFTTEFLTSAVNSAYKCYLTHLEASKQARESKQPRHGKGVENTTDILKEQRLHSHIAATEICLQYSNQIAICVKKWIDEDRAREKPDAFEGSDVEEFFDVYSPDLHQPILPSGQFGVGPSRYNGSDLAVKNMDNVSSQDQSLQISLSHRNEFKEDVASQVYGSLPDNTAQLGSDSISNSPLDEDIKLALEWQKQFDAENTHLLDQFQFASNLLSVAEPDLQANRRAAEKLQEEYDVETKNLVKQYEFASSLRSTTEPDIEENRKAAEKLQKELDTEAEGLLKQYEFALSLQNAFTQAPETIPQLKAVDLGSLDRDVSAQPTSQIELEEGREVKEKAHRWNSELWDEQERSANSSYEQAIRLQQQIERQEKQEQVALLQELLRIDEEQDSTIRADAVFAREAQSQWENSVQKQEKEARRVAEELARADAEEAKQTAAKFAEEERIQREAELRKMQIREEKRLKEQERADASRRQQEELERARKATQVECTACMDTGEKNDMVALPCCGLNYCEGCITYAFKAASKSKQPFQCCGRLVPVDLAARWLNNSFITSYRSLTEELSTQNPQYCSSRACSKFIPPRHVHGKIALCQSCKRKTCTDCRNEEHAGVCAEDMEGKAVHALAARNGWKECPTCKRICEKVDGCLHMTCKCRAEWCYSCVRPWNVCNSTCERR